MFVVRGIADTREATLTMRHPGSYAAAKTIVSAMLIWPLGLRRPHRRRRAIPATLTIAAGLECREPRWPLPCADRRAPAGACHASFQCRAGCVAAWHSAGSPPG